MMVQWITTFVKKLSSLSVNHAFNPYHDRCEKYDKPQAIPIRQQNLESYLTHHYQASSDTVFIGEALGYRGGRRTGIPFSSDKLLPKINHEMSLELQQATTSSMGESSATVIWKQLSTIEPEHIPLLWNAYPFHPYDNSPFSNRKPSRTEIKEQSWILELLLDKFSVDTVVAVGRTAQYVLEYLDIESVYIRHPSYGGNKEFSHQFERMFEKYQMS